MGQSVSVVDVYFRVVGCGTVWALAKKATLRMLVVDEGGGTALSVEDHRAVIACIKHGRNHSPWKRERGEKCRDWHLLFQPCEKAPS